MAPVSLSAGCGVLGALSQLGTWERALLLEESWFTGSETFCTEGASGGDSHCSRGKKNPVAGNTSKLSPSVTLGDTNPH